METQAPTRLNLRAHHLDFLLDVCTGRQEYPLNYSWGFYGREMAFYLADVHQKAREHPEDFEVTLVEGTDDFCQRCWMLSKCSAGKPFSLAGMLDINNEKGDADVVAEKCWEVGKKYSLKELAGNSQN